MADKKVTPKPAKKSAAKRSTSGEAATRVTKRLEKRMRASKK